MSNRKTHVLLAGPDPYWVELQHLLDRALSAERRRLLEPQEKRLPVTFVTYTVPASFDFMWQLQNMMAAAYLCGYEIPRICFSFDADSPSRVYGYRFLDNVVRPLMKMFGVSEVKEACGKTFNTVGYNPSGAGTLYEAHGVPPFPWVVDDEAARWADPYRGAVIITLRQCSHFPARNSNMPEWLAAADALTRRGERVVFVPDTEVLQPSLGNFECVSACAVDLQKRAALYGIAKANLFIANGSGSLCVCMPHIPYLYIVTKAAVEQFEKQHTQFFCARFDGKRPNATDATQWKLWLDVDRGEPGPNYRGPQQLWLWEEDTCDVILRGYDAIT